MKPKSNQNKKKGKIILDLCGGTGSWSKPYKESGFDVINISWPEYDVNLTTLDDGKIYFRGGQSEGVKKVVDTKDVYGILAAPPCTMFSYARTSAKTPRDLAWSMETVQSCLKIIWYCQRQLQSDQQKFTPLKFWAIENPYFGMLRWFLGEPAFVFDPYEFGDEYKKRTAIWGVFRKPLKTPIELSEDIKAKCKTNSRPLPKFDKLATREIHGEYYGVLDRKARRSITPSGFAYAFYNANNL